MRSMQAEMAKSTNLNSGMGGAAAADLAKYNSLVSDVKTKFIQAAQASGQWEAVQVRTTSATAKFNQAIAEQKVGITQLLKSRDLWKKSLQEHVALQNSVTVTDPAASGFGKAGATLLVPQGLGKDAVDAQAKMAYLNQTVKGAANEALNWGKNTQWAGRQLTAGFTMPVVLAAAAVGKLAYDMEAQLTHVTKIYEYSSQNVAAQAQEEAQLRASSLDMVGQAISKYGSNMNDVLQVEAQFAAQGKTGNDLMSSTNNVVRATTLTFQGAKASAQDYQDVFKATVALQSTFKMTQGQVTDAFNYFNVVESQTSLRMKDVIAAIPRSFGPLHALGLDLQQITTMLVAMKQGGVDASIGSNALKSSIGSIDNASPKAVKALAQFIDIKKVAEENNGNIFQIFQQLAGVYKDIQAGGDPKKMEQYIVALNSLFGKQQMARLIGVVQAMGDLQDKTTQVGRAYAVGAMSAEEWGNKSNEQLKRLHDSLSGQLKIAINSLQFELAKVGDSVLPIFTGIVHGVTSIVSAFSGMDPVIKKIAIFGLIFGAALGPLIMMAGLFANWIANIVKAGTAIAGLKYKYQQLTPEMKVQQDLMALANEAMKGEITATDTLSSAVGILTTKLTELNAVKANEIALAEEAAALEDARAGNSMFVNSAGIGTIGNRTIATDKSGGYFYGAGSVHPETGAKIGGRSISSSDRSMMEEAVAAKATADAQKISLATQQEVTQEASRTSQVFSKITGNTGLMVMGLGTVGSLLFSNNAQMTSFLGLVTAVGMAVQVIPWSSVATGLAVAESKIATVFESVVFQGKLLTALGPDIAKGMVSAFTSMSGFTSMLSKAGAALKGLLGGVGAASLGLGIALAAGIYLANRYNDLMAETAKRQENINNSAKGWADTLGFTYQQTRLISHINPLNSTDLQTDNALIKSFRDNNKDAADAITNASNAQDKFNLSIAEGIKVAQQGGTANQALTAVRTALLASHAADQTNINDMMIRVKATIDFGSQDDMAAELTTLLNSAMKKAASNVKPDSWLESFMNTGGASAKSLAGMDDVAAKFAASITGLKTSRQIADAFSGLSDSFNENMKGLYAKTMSTYSQDLANLHIKNATDLVNMMAHYKGVDTSNITDLTDSQKKSLDMLRNTSPEVNQMIDLSTKLAQSLGKTAGLSDDVINRLGAVGQVSEALVGKLIPVAAAQEAYNNKLAEARHYGADLDDSQKLLILNQERLAAGLQATTTLADAFNGTIMTQADALKQAAIAAGDYWNTDASTATNALKSAMSGTMNDIYKQADQALADHNQSVIDGITDNGNKAVAAIEANGKKQIAAEDAYIKQVTAQQAAEDKKLADQQSDVYAATKKAYDNKTKALQDQLKDEQAADAIRQKLFDAELTRIKRLAEAQNRNITFNAALNSGNLDEAAKISNDAQAAVSQYAIDDAKQSTTDATKARQDALQGKIDAINTERDATLEALKTTQDAAKQALKDKHAMTLQELNDKKQALQDQITANKSAQQQMTQDTIAATQKQQAADKQMLDNNLAALKAAVPKDKQELDSYIGQVEAAYGAYGINLRDKSGAWSKLIGDDLTRNVAVAATSLKDSIKWSDVSKHIVDEMGNTFGVSGADLITFLKTGTFPGEGKSNNGTLDPSGRYMTGTVPGTGGHVNRGMQHSGGFVNPGWSQHDRVGIPRSSALHPSEVPTVLKRGEFVMNEHAVARMGVKTMHAINNGLPISHPVSRHSGGEVGAAVMHGGGSIMDAIGANLIGASVARGIANSIALNINKAAAGLMTGGMFGVAAAGAYGGSDLGGDQMQNASIIMNVGRSMGASNRDLVVAIMTALQESSLRNINYGDRDSLGLFQQRPSQGWGTPEEILNPSYAAHKFFEGLLAIGGRNGLPTLGAEAQAVQHSGFPDAYDKWLATAEAIVNGTPVMKGGAFAGGTKLLQDAVAIGTGKPYVSGATGPAAFDCSGLVWRAMEDTGLFNGSRFVTQNFVSAMGNKISRVNNPGVGDVALWNGSLEHMGIVNGQDSFFSALNERLGILTNSISGMGGSPTFWRMNMPQLKVGGEIQYDNVVANLHKKETVLTAPLSQKLKDGIDKIDSGMGNKYSVAIDLRGAFVSKEIDIEKAVVNAIEKIESKTGRKRTVG